MVRDTEDLVPVIPGAAFFVIDEPPSPPSPPTPPMPPTPPTPPTPPPPPRSSSTPSTPPGSTTPSSASTPTHSTTPSDLSKLSTPSSPRSASESPAPYLPHVYIPAIGPEPTSPCTTPMPASPPSSQSTTPPCSPTPSSPPESLTVSSLSASPTPSSPPDSPTPSSPTAMTKQLSLRAVRALSPSTAPSSSSSPTRSDSSPPSSPSPPTPPTPVLCCFDVASALAIPSTSKDNPREIRNKAEKQRRDKLNRSIADLASTVPPVVAASRKIDKTGVLRLTAHYLRAHEYVFGDSLDVATQQFKSSSMRAVMGLFNGFLITVTYKGIIVVVSENVQQYLGYTELELLGHNMVSITHKDDQAILMNQLMPRKEFLGPSGELLVPDEPDGIMKVTEALGREKRKFVLRLKKLGQRSEPVQYIRCHVEGSFRKSDKACASPNRCCQMVRRARARSENHCTSGNDVVFIGVVRPEVQTFVTEIGLESCRMEYRTRHSIDGEIIQCEQRIALVTGYMIHEVQGVNAMNFMHKDDVHWVIIALRDMYDQHRLYGESCYRLMTKNGEFIYMRTRGRLDVDKDSRVVTSFVCTNTVVDEAEGKYLIKMMKKKFNIKTKKEGELLKLVDKEEADKKDLPVEDPRQLEKVILHLVTNLPSQGEGNIPNKPAICGASTSRGLAIIPPKKERIVSAIEKIYNIIKTFPKEPRQEDNSMATNKDEKQGDTLNAPGISQSTISVTELCSNTSSSSGDFQENLYWQKQLENSLQMPTTSVCTEPVYADFDLMTQPIEPAVYSLMTPQQVDDYASGNFLQAEANQSAVELKYQVLVAPGVNKNETTSQASSGSQVELPTSTKSLKRPNECLERSTTKKMLSNVSNGSDDELPDDDFSCLEALFDEEMLDKQIESAINSLEQSIDPTFPDLLISNEVQEILQQIEEKEKVVEKTDEVDA
ncbi:hypothetical protein O3G_MSEX004474 [Manduca sexta]|uniref:Methoprene-tolerant protein n=1 Tax=Manduca sexta TaxID=7130 RepID=A0A922CHX1_MANSE|nr:hypothetical protein O3G_MSEX004474 [Manduca sexta]KAG6446553.1 hypothetical protein O3G_MSEX004474 [Manduca sexta]KAG6446554.1 hypothetical protein O3G_MSEX004474 [Manduca sexta]